MASLALAGCKLAFKAIQGVRAHKKALKDYEREGDRLCLRVAACDPILTKAEKNLSSDFDMAMGLLQNAMEDIQQALEACKEYCEKFSGVSGGVKLFASKALAVGAEVVGGQEGEAAQFLNDKFGPGNPPDAAFRRLAEDLMFSLQAVTAAMTATVLDNHDDGGGGGGGGGGGEGGTFESFELEMPPEDSVTDLPSAEGSAPVPSMLPTVSTKVKKGVPTSDEVMAVISRQLARPKDVFFLPIQRFKTKVSTFNMDAKLYLIALKGEKFVLMIAPTKTLCRKVNSNDALAEIIKKWIDCTTMWGAANVLKRIKSQECAFLNFTDGHQRKLIITAYSCGCCNQLRITKTYKKKVSGQQFIINLGFSLRKQITMCLTNKFFVEDVFVKVDGKQYA